MIKNLSLICLLLFLNSFKSSKNISIYEDPNIDTSKIASIKITPAKPLIEKDIYGYYLNFDIVIKNQTTHVLELNSMEVAVMDATGKLVQRKSMNHNGRSEHVDVVGNAIIKPGESITIFNPFHTFTPDVTIATLKYGFFFNYADNQLQIENNNRRLPMDFDASVVKVITPQVYIAKNEYYLPLKGKIIVWDGHDFYSENRRSPVDAANEKTDDANAKADVAIGKTTTVIGKAATAIAKAATAIGRTAAAKGKTVAANGKTDNVSTKNANRYAYDHVSIDASGSMYHGSPFKKQNWYVFGKPVYVPSNGKIVAVQNNIPDNEFNGKLIQSPKLAANADPAGMGNYIIIDHGNGEYSVMQHMEQGSIKVRIGETVHAGDQIGTVGFSGIAVYPRLHYTVINNPKELAAEGIPSYFNDYKLYRGTIVLPIKRSRIDSGDIVESEK